jgi:hypothetical protein
MGLSYPDQVLPSAACVTQRDFGRSKFSSGPASSYSSLPLHILSNRKTWKTGDKFIYSPISLNSKSSSQPK